MHVESTALPSWLRWEKRKHSALVGLAILASAGIAAAATNERRMFLLPHLPFAFLSVPEPEPTTLRSAVMGYLNDGCVPDMDGGTGAIDRVVDSNDCGRGRTRPAPAKADPVAVPTAYFAIPDTPIPFDNEPLLLVSELGPIGLPDIGRSPFTGPLRPAAFTPPVLLSSVPEPASWAMMIGGFAMAGAAMRRRKPSPAPQG